MIHVLPDPPPGHGPDADGVLRIDCDECALQETVACSDCIITFLCGEEASSPVVVDLAEARAMRLLGNGGLAPPLRHLGTQG